MLRNCRWRAAALVALLMLAVFSAYAETNDPSLDQMEKHMQENFSWLTYYQFLAACKEQQGEELAREKALYYYRYYPDNIDIVWGVLMYSDPFEEPERIIEVGTKILRGRDLPPYSQDMPDKPHEAAVDSISGVYMAYVYAYDQLGNEEQLVKAVDWLVSYTEYEGYIDEILLKNALVACHWAAHYFVEHGNDEKAMPYVRKAKSLLDKYGEQYSDALENFMPEYESFFVSLLEKYPQEPEEQGS